MEKIPRHLFVDEGLIDQAYNDNPLPIESRQTISQPYIVALMSEAMALTGRGEGARNRDRFRVSDGHTSLNWPNGFSPSSVLRCWQPGQGGFLMR